MYGAHQYVVRADPASVIGEHSVESPIDHATEATETIEMSMEQSTASWAATTTLTELNEQICTCMQCPLGHTRTNFVFGSGNPNADIMIVGEAPGADEDEQGLPFVGRATSATSSSAVHRITASPLLAKQISASHICGSRLRSCNQSSFSRLVSPQQTPY
jgi:hypothetical protein